MIVEFIDKGFEYLIKGLDLVRGVLTTIASWLPWSEQLSLMVLFLVLSLWLSYNLIKKFVTNPISSAYILYYLIIVAMMFLLLMYL